MDWGAKPLKHRPLLSGPAIVVYLACFKLLVHVLTAGNYGYYRDELYFIAASEHLDLGYVDFPPFVAVLTAAVRELFGDSAVALQFLPALAGAGVLVLAGLMARELGGGRFAQGLAAVATLIAPNILVFGTWLSMDAFDQLFWALAGYVLMLIIKRDRPRLWLLFGVVTGVGLLIKVTMLFFGLAVFVSLMLTRPARRHLLSRWPWLGGAIALSFLLPYLYWQITHGWPTLEFWGNYRGKLVPNSLAELLLEQILTMHPATLPIWVAGLYYYLLSKEGRPYRVFGWVFVIISTIFFIQNAKFYFLAPAYPMLFAAGGVVIERFIRMRQWNWLKPAYVSFLLITGAIVASLAVVPVLSIETVARITGPVGNLGIESEAREKAQVPQTFAFRYGWEEMVKTIAGVYESLPQEEQAQSCILAGDFGEAGAIDFFGGRYGLPKAISGHNNYYIWGPRDCSGEVVISVGVPLERLEAVFEEIQEADTVECEYCMPVEDSLPVYVARKPKLPFEEAWRQFRHYN